MLVTHVEDRKSVFVVDVPETKTDKWHVITILGEDEMNSLKLIRDYMSLRPYKFIDLERSENNPDELFDLFDDVGSDLEIEENEEETENFDISYLNEQKVLKENILPGNESGRL
ncbi:hypothetical protein JTB14_009931 [Gonioctena quinquepunctata]|nr:hypothetical protein JTB14_009931 [Gonioctena quinquepunctata]